MKWIVTATLLMTFLSCNTVTLWPDGKRAGDQKLKPPTNKKGPCRANMGEREE